MLENSDGVKYISAKVGDCTQHFYVNGRVQLADPSTPWYNLDTWDIVELVDDTHIKISQPGTTDLVVDLAETAMRVFDIPDEVRSESLNKECIAPFRIQDDGDYADEEYWWNWYEATNAANEFTQDNQMDCRLENAYHNDVEYFGYESEEEEEESEDEDEEESED